MSNLKSLGQRDIKESLSEIEQTELHRHESVIQRGKQAFIEVGTALMSIRDGRLYKSEYDTFEEYCQKRWGFSKSFANKGIISAEIADTLGTIVPIPNEGTAREFIAVPAEERPSVAERAKAIAATHGRDTINSRDVKEAKSGFNQSKNQPDPVLSVLTDDQARRLNLAKQGYSQLANQHTDSALIKVAQEENIYCRIDRNSIWGNPFVLNEDGDRETVIENYSDYLHKRPSLIRQKGLISGKILGCWCYPEECHGHVLIKDLHI